jgi:nicotinic acid mononucleotide adenylyltransferase
VVSVCRSHEADAVKAHLTSKWNQSVFVVEDSAILDASLDAVTSRTVREKMKGNESVEYLVGSKINDYVNAHRLQAKVSQSVSE